MGVVSASISVELAGSKPGTVDTGAGFVVGRPDGAGAEPGAGFSFGVASHGGTVVVGPAAAAAAVEAGVCGVVAVVDAGDVWAEAGATGADARTSPRHTTTTASTLLRGRRRASNIETMAAPSAVRGQSPSRRLKPRLSRDPNRHYASSARGRRDLRDSSSRLPRRLIHEPVFVAEFIDHWARLSRRPAGGEQRMTSWRDISARPSAACRRKAARRRRRGGGELAVGSPARGPG